MKIETIKGYLKTIIYSSNGFYICKFLLDEDINRYIIVKGNFDNLQTEQLYELHGKFSVHHKYGKQFEVTHYQIVILDDSKYLITYLSSNLFPTIGLKTATKIVDFLKTNILQKIKDDKNILTTIGVSKKQSKIIYDKLQQSTIDDDLIAIFAQHEIPLSTLSKLKTFYGDKLKDVLNQPYQIIDDHLLSFAKTDQIALAMKIDKNNIIRLAYAFEDAIKKLTFKTGDSYIEKNIALKQLSKYNFDLNALTIKNAFQKAISLKKIIFENNHFYLKSIYTAEKNIANYLQSLNQKNSINTDEIIKNINLMEQKNKFIYDQTQRQALNDFITNNLLIISGAAGTGKTTLVKGLIDLYKMYYPKANIAISAPTGRAARRLNQQTKHPALTLHKMLMWDINSNTFKHNEQNPLEYDLVIIDEMSMVDTILFDSFIKSAINLKKLVLVGDPNQLPSVNSGNILYDLLQYQHFNIIKLLTIYRQQEDSHIINLSLNIKDGNCEYDYPSQKQLMMIDIEDRDEILIAITNIFKQLLEKDNIFQIQIISPMYAGILGINNLNQVIQNAYNPYKSAESEIKIGSVIFRVRDKVMQTKNQPEQDIYNGDIGIIKKVNHDSDQWSIDVLYDDKTIIYSNSNIEELIHAYAVSVHKSQGSEYEKVIIVIDKQFIHMLQRNLLYTAVTRCQQQLFIIGCKKWFDYGIIRVSPPRQTTLLKRIIDVNTKL